MSFDSGDFVFCTCDEHESEEYDDRSEDWSVVCPWSEGEDWGGNPEWVSARAIARSGPEDWGVEWPWSDDEDRGGSPEWVRPRVIARESGPWGKNGEGEEGESEDKQVESEDEEGGTGEVYEEEGQDYDADFEEKGEEEGQDHNELQAYEDSEEREEEHEEGQEYVEDSKEPDHEGGEEEYKEEYEEEDGSEDIQQSDYQASNTSFTCCETIADHRRSASTGHYSTRCGLCNIELATPGPLAHLHGISKTALLTCCACSTKCATASALANHGSCNLERTTTLTLSHDQFALDSWKEFMNVFTRRSVYWLQALSVSRPAV